MLRELNRFKSITLDGCLSFLGSSISDSVLPAMFFLMALKKTAHMNEIT